MASVLSIGMLLTNAGPAINVHASNQQKEERIAETVSLNVVEGDVQRLIEGKISFQTDTSQEERNNGRTSKLLPLKYSSKDLGYMPPIRDQEHWGTCWAQATTASMEISMIKQGLKGHQDVDLSEAHLIYYCYRPTVDSLEGMKGDYNNTATTSMYDTFMVWRKSGRFFKSSHGRNGT